MKRLHPLRSLGVHGQRWEKNARTGRARAIEKARQQDQSMPTRRTRR